MVNLAKRVPPGVRQVPTTINGEAGFVGWSDGVPVMAIAVEVRDDVICTVRIMLNEDKLHALAR